MEPLILVVSRSLKGSQTWHLSKFCASTVSGVWKKKRATEWENESVCDQNEERECVRERQIKSKKKQGVCVCVCVCVRDRESEREREREREKEIDKQRNLQRERDWEKEDSVCVCVCMCEWERERLIDRATHREKRKETRNERKRQREREIERGNEIFVLWQVVSTTESKFMRVCTRASAHVSVFRFINDMSAIWLLEEASRLFASTCYLTSTQQIDDKRSNLTQSSTALFERNSNKENTNSPEEFLYLPTPQSLHSESDDKRYPAYPALHLQSLFGPAPSLGVCTCVCAWTFRHFKGFQLVSSFCVVHWVASWLLRICHPPYR